jgi:hypothetical protein
MRLSTPIAGSAQLPLTHHIEFGEASQCARAIVPNGAIIQRPDLQAQTCACLNCFASILQSSLQMTDPSRMPFHRFSATNVGDSSS